MMRANEFMIEALSKPSKFHQRKDLLYLKKLVKRREDSLASLEKDKADGIDSGNTDALKASIEDLKAYIIDRQQYKDEATGKIEQFAQEIMTNCREFLDQIGWDLNRYTMWRGINIKEMPDHKRHLGKMKARLADRKPTDTSQEYHEELNRYFDSKFGHPYRNGVFASGDPAMANGYGVVTAMFPIGNFDFIWSQEFIDVYNDIGGVDAEYDAHDNDWWFKTWALLYDVDWKTLDFEERVNTDFSSVGISNVADAFGRYTNRDLPSALRSDHEIMVWTPEYYYIAESLLPQVAEIIKNAGR